MPIKPKSRPVKVVSGVPDFKDVNGLWARRVTTTEDGFYVQRSTRAISLWESLHRRIAKQADYADVTCLFDNFQGFAEWCQTQVGYTALDNRGRVFELDKDILAPQLRCYSAETCCFVPKEVNAMFITSGKLRGVWPIGVCFNRDRNKFQANGSVDGVWSYLGLHMTPAAAHAAWQNNRVKGLRKTHQEYAAMENRVPAVVEAIAKRIEALEADIASGRETIQL